MIGIPYIEGKRNCWTFVKEAAKRVNIILPDYDLSLDRSELSALVQAEKQKYIRLKKPEPFCLVLFHTLNLEKGFGWHCGLVMENCQDFLHCHKWTGGCITSLNHPLYWLLRDGYYKPGDK